MLQNLNVTFSFKEVFKTVNGKKTRVAVMLVDNSDHICGIYNNYREAKEAMPKIRKNIIFELKKRLKAGKSIPAQFLNG